MKKLLILGDSTSMTVGLEKEMYLFLLANEPMWSEGTQLINSSQPGMTAADSAAYFFQKIKNCKDVNAVIIYLGNCDANATELKKGRYTPGTQLYYKICSYLKVKPVKTLMYNKLLRYQWNERNYDASLESKESPEDFKYNLLRVVKSCKKKNIPVILVRPKANLLFPSGVGKGNFIFYHYYNLDIRMSDQLSFPDIKFSEAYQKYEKGDYESSRKEYKEILENFDSSFFSAEYSLLVTHNYAISCMKLGRLKESEVIFHNLLKEHNSRRDIFLYNLALLHKLQKNQEKHLDCMNEAYEIDTSMYRVKKSYIDVMDEIINQYQSTISVVDVTEVSDALFVDHCHLLPKGQVIIKNKVKNILKNLGLVNGKKKALIKNDLLNLELSLGNTSEFHQYYKTYASCSLEVINRNISRLRENLKRDDQFSDFSQVLESSEISRAVGYYRRHPCFSHPEDICRFPPKFLSDIGRFPEYFLIRQIIPYFQCIEKDLNYTQIFPDSLGLVRKSDDLFSILPFEDQFVKESVEPRFDPDEDQKWVGRIISSSQTILREHIEHGPQINERLMTTIYWFFRETLRWGAHSRNSMRYDRLTLEYVAEALNIAGWINYRHKGLRENQIKALAQLVIDLVEVHEKYASQFSLDKDNQCLFTKYAEELKGLNMDCCFDLSMDFSSTANENNAVQDKELSR